MIVTFRGKLTEIERYFTFSTKQNASGNFEGSFTLRVNFTYRAMATCLLLYYAIPCRIICLKPQNGVYCKRWRSLVEHIDSLKVKQARYKWHI